MSADTATHPVTRTGNRIGLLFTQVYVLGLSGVLLGGFYFQFAHGEHPCPLCVLQRMFLMLTAIGGAYVLARSRSGAVSTQDMATGYGISVISALAGATVSTRQVLLHISPADTGYGGTVFGLHLYTWALVTFVAAALGAGVHLLLVTETLPAGGTNTTLTTVVLWLFGLIVLANVLSTFALEGFSWVLPDDPTRYELFHDLGIG